MNAVKIYTTPTCPHCKRAKQFLEDNNIYFENVDVSSDPGKAEEMKEKSGQMGVPVIDVNGKIITGFDQEELRKALSL